MKWNDFQENISTGFKELRSDKELTDVTLACEDGQQIEAHKVVLTTSSPLFMSILKSKKSHQHPLIYMRGVKFEDLVAIIDFLYCGEANVYQEHLDAFLVLAEELKLKGLTGEREKDASVPPKSDLQGGAWSQNEPTTTFHRKEQHVSVEPKLPLERKCENERTVSLQTTDSDKLDEQIKSMMEPSGNFITRNNGRKNLFNCKVCGKEGEVTDVRRHIEANHLTNVSHSCDVCGKTSRSRDGLRHHKREHKKMLTVSGPEMA